MDKWGHKLRLRAILIRADSSVALAMSRKLSSPHPSLNFLAAELALRLEKFEIQRVVHHHLRGSLNVEADWLSRLLERGDKPKPPGLEGVRLMRAAPWKASHFWLRAPGDPSAGENKFLPQSNIFDHLATR